MSSDNFPYLYLIGLRWNSNFSDARMLSGKGLSPRGSQELSRFPFSREVSRNALFDAGCRRELQGVARDCAALLPQTRLNATRFVTVCPVVGSRPLVSVRPSPPISSDRHT